jgi:hypothetical protein
MAADTFLLMVRADIVRAWLSVISQDRPTLREADIQAAKLERMINNFHEKFASGEDAPKEGSRALRKKIGMELHVLDQQAKRMDELFLKTMEEDFFAKYPTGHTRKAVRCLLAIMSRALEQKLYQDALEVRREVFAVVAEQRQLSA